MKLYENINSDKERALLVSVDTGDFDAEVSIEELEELSHTAGAEVIGKIIQKKDRPENATFVGLGKLAEIIAFCQNNDIDIIIVDSELSPSQQRNLEKLTKVRVIDRTMLILDIFALHATSGEGKLQVELAQLRYRQSQLTGAGKALSRRNGKIPQHIDLHHYAQHKPIVFQYKLTVSFHFFGSIANALNAITVVFT